MSKYIIWMLLSAPLIGCSQGSYPPQTATDSVHFTVPNGKSVAVHIATSPKNAANKLVLGFSADFSEPSATRSVSILRGMEIAIDELNDSGGVLGKRIQIETKERQGEKNSVVSQLNDFAQHDNLIAVFSGLQSEHALSQVETVHTRKLLYLIPADGTSTLIENRNQPNFAFRLALPNETVGEFLIQKAHALGYRSPALILESTLRGRDVYEGVARELDRGERSELSVFWFMPGKGKIEAILSDVVDSGCDCLIFIGDSSECRNLLVAQNAWPQENRIPIFTDGHCVDSNFFTTSKDILAGHQLFFVQTFSTESENSRPGSQQFWNRYRTKYADDQVFDPSILAQAYDLVHLLACSIEKAQSTDPNELRKGLESLPSHHGLIRDYEQAFSNSMHDALSIEDSRIARFNESGDIIFINEN